MITELPLLSEAEFEQTFGTKMIAIDFDTKLLDIPLSFENLTLLEPEAAYRADTFEYEHHLRKTDSENVFLVYVKYVRVPRTAYHILDLNEKYGINQDS